MIRARIRPRKETLRAVEEELRKVLAPEDVSSRVSDLYSYTGTTLSPKALPHFVVRPKTVEQVQGLVRVASRFRFPLTPIASGSQESSTHPFFGGIVVDVSGMNRILEINLDSAYALIEPGVSIGVLAREVSKVGHRCTVGSFPPGLSVIGNYTLTNVNTHRSSGIRDEILGLEVVLADGTVVRTGSRAFAETYPETGWFSSHNAHPDLRALFLDAYGTLGIITKAAVRIYAANDVQCMPLAAFPDYGSAVKYMERLCRANLVQHVCAWHWVLYTMIDHLQTYKHGAPMEIVVNDPWQPPDDRPYIIVVPVMSGVREDMEGHEKALLRIMQEMGGRWYNDECARRFPGAMEYFTEHFIHHRPSTTFMGGYGEAKPMFPIVIIDPSKAADFEHWALRYLRDSPLKFGLSYYSHAMDQSRALFLRLTPFVPSGQDERECREVYEKVMEEAFARYGAVPMRMATLRTIGSPEGALTNRMGGYGSLLRRIKKALDPHNIMNSGFSVGFYGEEESVR